ncbi:MAG: carboxypeptidase-like regulatory domain-containing protein [Candidatus Sumerlaeia bacterium]
MSARRIWSVIWAMIVLATVEPAVAGDLWGDEEITTRTVRADNIDELNRYLHRAKKYTPGDFLAGPNQLAISVVDAVSGRPVTRYRIDGEISIVVKDERRDDDFEPVTIGRLETRRVSDLAGRCVYRGLARATMFFLIRAEGYVPCDFVVRVNPGTRAKEIRLDREVTVRGRVIAKSGGKPLEGMNVTLHHDYHSKVRGHYPGTLTTKTDKAGVFSFAQLPPDRYSVQVVDNSTEKGGRLLLPSGQIDESRPESHDEEFMRENLFVRRGSDADIGFVKTKGFDAGTIQMEPARWLRLELVDEQGNPLPFFPYIIQDPRVFYGDESEGRGCTNENGRAFIKVADGEALYAPAPMQDDYKIQEYIEPDPLKNWNEQGIVDNFAREWHLSFKEHARLENFSPKMKKQYAQYRDEQRAQISSEHARVSALPEHPNARVLHPKPGEILDLKMTVHPVKPGFDMHITARDKDTSHAIQNVTGLITESESYHYLFMVSNLDRVNLHSNGDNVRPFRGDATGKITIPMFVPSPEIIANFREYLRYKKEELDPSLLQSEEKRLMFHVLARADGYADQAYTLPLALALTKKPLAIEMRREARVRGRVLIAGTNEPVTSVSLRALLEKSGQWNKQNREEWERIFAHRLQSDPLAIEMKNPSITWPGSLDRSAYFASLKRAVLGADGRFEIKGLLPRAHWSVKCELPLLAKTSRLEIALKTGDNDLGDIFVTLPGEFAGRVFDDAGRPMKGARIELPGDTGKTHFKKVFTDKQGEFRFDLENLEDGERQLVRVVPPWGLISLDSPLSPLDAQVFDTTAALTRSAADRLEVKIPRGNTLFVEIPATPARAELKRLFSNIDDLIRSGYTEFKYMYPADKKPQIALRGAQIQAMTPTPDGMLSAIDYVLPGDGARFTNETMSLRIEHVPPGRHALVLMAGIYGKEGLVRLGKESMHKTPAELNGWFACAPIPIGYMEFEMKATTTTVSIEVSSATLTVALANPPELSGARVPSTGILIEHVGPTSMLFGSEFSKVMTANPWRMARDATKCSTPLMAFLADMWWSDEKGPIIKPAIIRPIPPGTWRVRTFSDSMKLINPYPAAYDDRLIQVPPNTAVKIEVPFQRSNDPASEVRVDSNVK